VRTIFLDGLDMVAQHISRMSPVSDSRTATPASGVDSSTIAVCHVSMTLRTGGLERLLVEFGRHYDRERFQLRFVAFEGLGEPARELGAMGFPVQSLGETAVGRLGRLRGLARMFREHRIQVVHTHNTQAHFYASLAARMAGVPVVVNSQHGRGCGGGWKSRLQFRLSTHWTDRVIGVSRDSADQLRRLARHSSERIETICNGVDPERFDFQGSSLQPTAIAVGRLSPEKDFGTLLRAAWIVIKDQPTFRLRIVGDGPERPALEALARELGLGNHVEFLGERSDVPALLRESGFFVTSSRTEGIPLTLLEAMAVGLPIVATRVGGNPEIVVDGGNGRLVPSGSPERLALAMRELLNDVDTWPAMGQLGRQLVDQHFNVRNVTKQYEDLYRELLKASGRTGT